MKSKRTITVREQETDKEILRTETGLTGGNYERFLDGLFAKVDFGRFYIQLPEDDSE